MGGGAWTTADRPVIGVSNRVVTVRRAMTGDLAAVQAIEAVSFSDPWTVDAFASALELRHMRFLVAEEREGEEGGGGTGRGSPGAGESVLLGYVVALVVADEGEIADLAVAPAARRRGIGGRLLDRVALEAEQTGIRALYLEVRESNASARALYESRGFTVVGRRRGYYQNPREDALLLRRALG
jgi:ribosomal-protein-alanine N-acetyltransferase